MFSPLLGVAWSWVVLVKGNVRRSHKMMAPMVRGLTYTPSILLTAHKVISLEGQDVQVAQLACFCLCSPCPRLFYRRCCRFLCCSPASWLAARIEHFHTAPRTPRLTFFSDCHSSIALLQYVTAPHVCFIDIDLPCICKRTKHDYPRIFAGRY